MASSRVARSELQPGPVQTRLSRQFHFVAAEAEALSHGVSDAAFNWRPSPGTPSIAQCIAHLTETGNRLLPRIEAALSPTSGRAEEGRGKTSIGLLARLYSRATAPHADRPQSTKSLRPNPQSVAELLPRFIALQKRVADCADRVQPAGGPLSASALRFLRLDPAGWLKAILSHQERHLQQARAVRNHPDFPA